MNLYSITQSFAEKLKESKMSDCAKIISAYPVSIKPTFPKKPFIAVAAGEIEAENISLGDCSVYGTVCLITDIYVPQNMDSSLLFTLARQVFERAQDYCAFGISMSQVKYDSACNCLWVRCKIKINSDVDFGGEENG